MAKYKMKSHSGAKKRIKKLKSGLFKASRAYHRHNLTKRSSDTKREMRKALYVKACDVCHIKPLLPY